MRQPKSSHRDHVSGKETRIAYLGGSITEAGNGWRRKTTRWFQQEFPKTPIQELVAAIGGSGSDLGVFRYGKHALEHKPDRSALIDRIRGEPDFDPKRFNGTKIRIGYVMMIGSLLPP